MVVICSSLSWVGHSIIIIATVSQQLLEGEIGVNLLSQMLPLLFLLGVGLVFSKLSSSG